MPTKRDTDKRTCPVCDETKYEAEYYKMDWMCKECKRTRNKENYWRKKSEKFKAEDTLEDLVRKIRALELHVEALQGELKQVKRVQTKGIKEVEKNGTSLNEENMKEIKRLIKKVVRKEVDRIQDDESST